MFDEILKAVKEHFAENPHITADIPAEHHDAIHNEIAEHVTNNLSNTDPSAGTTAAATAPEGMVASSGLTDTLGGLTGGLGGLVDKLKDGVTSGNPIVTAIEGGLIGSLASKLGLGSAVTG